MNILMVDDAVDYEDGGLVQLGIFLEEAGGHKVFFAPTPSKARLFLSREEIDFVLTDLHCPERSDGEAFILFVSTVARKPISVLSGLLDDLTVSGLKHLGVEAYFDKVDLEHPVKILALIGRHAANRQS